MSAAIPESRQCVIWFGTPEQCEIQELILNGWQTRAIPPGHAFRFGLRSGDTVVGAIDFTALTHPSDIEPLTQSFQEHAHLPLLALVNDADENQLSDDAKRLLARCHARSNKNIVDIVRKLSLLSRQDFPLHAMDAEWDLLGESSAMQALRASIRKFAPVELPVLITGDTGTGKEMAARALHLRSERRDRPFRAINCGAISSTLVQSELFGHERGAFTGAAARRHGLFETADNGTVLLDEIGDLPLDAQTNLLRVLQEGTIERVGGNQSIRVNVRVIAATHVDLEHAVAQGKFREDLYYRLNVLRLAIPPLNQRDGDISLLASHFLSEFRSKHSVRARGFCSSARQAMQRFPWPGNVRELLNRVQRAAITSETELITCHELGLTPYGEQQSDKEPLQQLNAIRAVAERETLLSYLEKSRYNISACARLMKVSRVTIYRLCRKHQLLPNALRH